MFDMMALQMDGDLRTPGHHNNLCPFVLQDTLQHGFHLLLPLLFRHVRLADADKVDAKLLGNVLQVWVVGHDDIDVAFQFTCSRAVHDQLCCRQSQTCPSYIR